MQKWFMNNLGLKITALVLAIVTWLYISEELNKRQQPRNYPKSSLYRP